MIKTSYTLEQLNERSTGNMVGYLGIVFTEITDTYICAKMPVDERTKQPMGLLHGGASVVLAESLGSIASWMVLEDHNKFAAVGVEINANHLKSAREGYVYAKCSPLKIGRTMHVWDIKITDEKGDLVCASRLTTAIIEKRL
ncbi:MULTISPECIES: hotdog fold thioesterase [unclassified Arcicella]|uniref:hotdog fold thioesterase n=1 Tax=unclassified Arcicella TaxID=2644986 RepID=UPI002858E07A|nr:MULTISPECIES: hotdog fold thioesterase [unclassified Arcicella]MDR6560743.1 1,4-dihydroxy-2-naphthoyl-CoA hydrolase [Arcicella sp. BE51]MDR6810627.1 1,4-dihydroxy-2-naphthoyl-CoA hydrolase [Arcicella sp. BE140]MDR6821977.1 1,4-dihydroxy-2-naphthoyl-CoA hydrolase [Arcicella sp. BE139]